MTKEEELILMIKRMSWYLHHDDECHKMRYEQIDTCTCDYLNIQKDLQRLREKYDLK
jgi:hypothetical protein